MNPLTNVKNITKLNETELASGSIHKKSWHDIYKESAWIFIGGLQYALTEGDILAVFSQYGEIVNVNLVRDKKSGKSKGFCFLCYSNQKSTVLAVDNFNGIKLCNRTIRVDHVANYKPPKENEKDDEITKTLKSEGCAPKLINDTSDTQLEVKKKKSKKEKKEKKKKKRKNNLNTSDSEKDTSAVEIKKERYDPGYDKYDMTSNEFHMTKVKDQERCLEKLKGESSHTHEKYRSKADKQNYRTRENNFADGDSLLKKIKQEEESSQHRKTYKDSTKHATSSKSHKRKRSKSSSDDTTRNRIDNIRHKGDRDQTKDRHSEGKRNYKETRHNSSSSSDDEDSSSTQSSSGDEKEERKSKYSRKEKYKSSDEQRSYQEENRHKDYQISKDSNYASSRSRLSDTAEKYSEHRSKSKYRSDDADHKNSHYRTSKHEKRVRKISEILPVLEDVLSKNVPVLL